MSTVGYPFVVFEMLHVSFKSEQEKGAKQFDRTPFFSSYPLKLLSSDQCIWLIMLCRPFCAGVFLVWKLINNNRLESLSGALDRLVAYR